MDAKRLITAFLAAALLSLGAYAATPLINCTGTNRALQSAASPPSYTCATISGGGSGVASVTGTAPVVSSGGPNPNISIPQATGSVNGYLGSSDWTTFNNKQGAITLTTTGTSGASTLSGSTLNIPNYSTGGTVGPGTTGQIADFTSSTTIGSIPNPQAISQISGRILVDPRNYGAVCDGAVYNSLNQPVQQGTDDDTRGFYIAAGAAALNGGAVLVPDGCWIANLGTPPYGPLPPGTAFVGQGWAPNYGYDYGNGSVANITLTPGSGYTDGTYAITVTTSHGSGFAGTVTVSGGKLTNYAMSNQGNSYYATDTIAVPAGAGGGTGGAIVPLIYQKNQPFTRPVLYTINAPTRGIDLSNTENIALVGFEVSGFSSYSGFSNTDCVGSSAGSYGFGGKMWFFNFSAKGCVNGFNPQNGYMYTVSEFSDWGTNGNGIQGSTSDFLSFGDTFASDSGAGIIFSSNNGGFARVIGDRFEYNTQNIVVNGSGEMNFEGNQFDHTQQCSIQLNTWQDVTITGGAMRWSGIAGSFQVTGAANNGSGLIRLAVSNSVDNTSGITTGNVMQVDHVGGTTEANGTWTITVIDGTHVDLQGSTFTHAYTSGGYAGVNGKDAAICMSATGYSQGLHVSNVGFYSGSWLGQTPAPAYIFDTTTTHNDYIELIGGVAQSIYNVGSINYNSYSIGVANWEGTTPAHVHIDAMGSTPFRNDTTVGSTNGSNFGIGTTAPNPNSILDMGSSSLPVIPPQWTTGGRPASPPTNSFGFNTTTGSYEFWNGSTWTSMGGFAAPVIAPNRVVTASGAVTVSASTDYLIIINKTSGAATTVNLPASPNVGFIVLIKDGKGDAATNNITVTPASGTIDGSATAVMATNYQILGFVWNGTQWNIM
jgi:hypothetical protein